jgi:hypothetical protein
MTSGNETYYLNAFHGGLGDWLQFSTLPEQLHKQFGSKTYITKDAAFRNEGIKELMLLNPFISGISGDSGDWNLGDIPDHQSNLDNQDQNGVKLWERFFGLDPVSNCPKVYYDPKTNDDLKDTVLVSLSGVTRFVMSDAMKPIVDELIEKYQDKKVLMITHSDEIDHKTFDNFHKDGTLLIRSITDYCDALASCDVFISTHSGQSHLSSAMKRHNHNMESHCIVEESFLDIDRKRGTHIYENVNYITF